MQLMGSLIFLLVANVEINFPISWQASMRPDGPHFTNLRFIIIGPSDFDKKIQTLDNYFPLNHSHILLLIGLWEGKIVFS
jgi:hypothetical protein